MKKQMILAFGLAVLVCAAAVAQLPRGENAIFLQNGQVMKAISKLPFLN